MSDEVLRWDVLDGDVLGAVIRCPTCPCGPDNGCAGNRELFRAYRLPGGAPIDLYRDPEAAMRFLDSHLASRRPSSESDDDYREAR